MMAFVETQIETFAPALRRPGPSPLLPACGSQRS
jgi:hypothetical protein